MLPHKQLRIAKAYLFLQIVIWVKSAFFFMNFGHGKVLLFSVKDFPPGILVVDYWFHTAMHVLIGLLALLFGRGLEKFELKKILPLIFVAVALHNVGYWLTNSHPNLIYSVTDFVTDSIILTLAVWVGYLSRQVGLFSISGQ